MILLDANLLLYAYDSASREHHPAALWFEQVLMGPRTVCLSWPTVLAFLRIATNPGILAHPYQLEEAAELVTGWLAHPNVSMIGPTEYHWQILRGLLPKSRVRGSLIMDAHLAALAIEHGATLYTNDRDFARFPGLRVEYPLQ